MATKAKNTADIDLDMEEALEKALDLDLGDDLDGVDLEADLADELSLDDFEAQVAQATDELKTATVDQPAKPNGVGAEAAATAAAGAAAIGAISKSASSINPANDDSASKDFAQTMQRLDAPAPSGSFAFVSIISLLWLAGGAALAHMLYAPEIWAVRTFDDVRAIPGAIAILVATIVPIIVFYVLAVLLRRAAEMRHTAKSMSEIAFRLAAPEKLAEEQVATVGQAVRREVAAMGEGIERTIARATELEAMMQSEVGELERVYTDNEVRVRSLLTDLGNEREGIVSHAERLRASISGAHEQLRDELSHVSQNIRENVLNASTEMTMA
ncbi:MAG: kinesin, partial [Pseudomonadota bacterium]